jgi:hypothetical protein
LHRRALRGFLPGKSRPFRGRRLTIRVLTLALPAFLATLPAAAAAQLDAPVRNSAGVGIVVTGKRLTPDGKPIAMSGWRVAETDHVLFYARADEKQVARVARNLERLHFLLSILLNRVGREENTIKVSVTQIGDGADFRNMRLGHARWQEGPFPKSFPDEYYYDPRDDGPVLATTRDDQKIILQRGYDLWTVPIPMPDGARPEQAFPGSSVTPLSAGTLSRKADEIAFAATAEGRLYAGFAQNYLLTYFPAAYPRWYLDGFGEMFSTFAPDKEGVLEYGRAPDGFGKVMEWYGRYRLADVLSGKYLTERSSKTDWTPYHAWSLVHLLFFSDEWRQPLHAYLAAVAHGAPPGGAAAALGDVARLEREWRTYHGKKVPFEKLTYPSSRIGEPLVRQLTRDQADFLERRLVMGARVEIAAARPGEEDEQADALERRTKWLADLRSDAAGNPDRLDLQLLLAEAACRSEAWSDCLVAADRTLALAPRNGSALAWKGTALAAEAASLAEPQRTRQLAAARVAIVRANRADPEAPLPLLAYYRTFADERGKPPDLAVLGLVKAETIAPAASETRLLLGSALARRGTDAEAKRILTPLTNGAHDTPERPEATAILARMEDGSAK